MREPGLVQGLTSLLVNGSDVAKEYAARAFLHLSTEDIFIQSENGNKEEVLRLL